MSDETDCEAVSGPFCRHYADPADCPEVCARPGCSDPCCEHGRSECSRDGCGCPEFVDAEAFTTLDPALTFTIECTRAERVYRPPYPRTAEEARLLAQDCLLFGMSVQDTATGARVPPSEWPTVYRPTDAEIAAASMSTGPRLLGVAS
jgi:hypothetical protein